MELEELLALFDQVISDNTIPRNVRKVVSEAKDVILKEEDKLVGLSEASYMIDEITNDVNIPMHARTQLWNLLSAIESVKETIKK